MPKDSNPSLLLAFRLKPHQPRDFSESGPATTIHEADPPAELAAMNSGMPQWQPWRHNANAPALPPSPTVDPQSVTGLIDGMSLL
jgi:hypothetical protein